MQEQPSTMENEGRSARLHEREQAHAGTEHAGNLAQSSEERFRKIFNHSNDAIFVMDPVEDRIIDANPRACEMLGYSREALLTTVKVSDIHPHEIGRLKAFAQSVLQEGSGWTDELSCMTKDGSLLPSEMSASVLETGDRPYLITIVRDVSDRKRAEKALQESEQRFRALVENAGDAIFLIDQDGSIVDINQTACDSLGYTREEMLRLNIQDFIVGATASRMDNRFRMLRERKSATVEGTHRRKDGTTFPVETRMSLLTIDGQDRLLAVARDITERKRAEAAEREQRTLAEALRDTAAVLNSTLDFDKVLERILLNVERVVPHAVADILLIDAGIARTARVRCVQPALQEKMPELRLSVVDTPHLETMRETGQAVVIPDTRRHSSWSGIDELYWVRSYVGAPILLDEAVTGFINLYNVSPGFFSGDHADRLQAFRDQASIAIQNARVHERAQEVAALEERQRIARDLHDSVTQALSSANLIAQVLPRLWKRDPDAALEDVADLQRLTQASLAEMRALLLELRPSVLREASLNDLLQQLVDAAAGRRAVTVSSTFNSHEALPDDVKIAFYRIAQEALNNATRHSQATEISVSLCDTERGTVLRIADDGRGFDPDAVPAGHFGVRIMHERAEAVGARVEIQSEADAGSEIIAVWPAPAGG